MSAEISQSDPHYHTTNIRRMLSELIDHARDDSTKVSDPKVRALFETTSEVLIAVRNAFEDYERRNEPASGQRS